MSWSQGGWGWGGSSGQLRKRLPNKLKLTGYQSIHPTEKFARLPGGDKLPREPPPASSPEDRPMGMKPRKKWSLLGLLPLIYLVTSPHFCFQSFLWRRVAWHQASGCTDVALRGAGTRECHSRCNGQTAGRYEGAPPPRYLKKSSSWNDP